MSSTLSRIIHSKSITLLPSISFLKTSVIAHSFNFKKAIPLSTAPPDKVELFINDEKVYADPGTTILQACAQVGVEIPRFCYHERLSIAGNCRMCLVQVEKSAKPIASCAMPVGKGMRVHTDTDFVKKAREGVMEFLLVNHPLDCPICDQGGECDLQDQSMAFGSDRSRFIDIDFSGKRAVEDKDIGPLVKTIMTRCIHCTRCVRFASEIAGIDDLGTTGRGSDMQIGTYVEKMLYSELSGNVIDLCPVGALTSKPYSFTARPWELRSFGAIDVQDAIGSNIIVGHRAGSVMRIIPNLNESINEEWISDKTRFSYDGLSYQRLTIPMLKSNGTLVPCDWENVLPVVVNTIKSIEDPSSQILVVVGALCEVESMYALKRLFSSIGGTKFFTEFSFPKLPFDEMNRCQYILNSELTGVENCDHLFLVGCNPRFEAAVFNARIRKCWVQNELPVSYLGAPINLTYEYNHVGSKFSDLMDIVDEKNVEFVKELYRAKKPMIILGTSALQSNFSYGNDYVYKLALKLAANIHNKGGIQDPNWKVFNVLHSNASQVGAMDLGYRSDFDSCSDSLSNVKLVYMLGADECVVNRSKFSSDCTFIYQGHNGDAGAACADIILPGCTFTEKSGTYVNTEGRVQYSSQVVSPPERSREDWKILRVLSEVLGKTQLPFDTLAGLHAEMKNDESISHLITHTPFKFKAGGEEYQKLMRFAETQIKSCDLTIPKASSFVLKPPIVELKDYYQTNAISRSSPTMARCVKAALKASQDKELFSPELKVITTT